MSREHPYLQSSVRSAASPDSMTFALSLHTGHPSPPAIRCVWGREANVSPQDGDLVKYGNSVSNRLEREQTSINRNPLRCASSVRVDGHSVSDLPQHNL